MKARVLAKDNKVLINKILIADGFFGRGIGLLGRRGLGRDVGMLISPCRSVHTFMMRFGLDLIYLSAEGEVLGFSRSVKPWRWRVGPSGCEQILELEAGWFDFDLLGVGDRVVLS